MWLQAQKNVILRSKNNQNIKQIIKKRPLTGNRDKYIIQTCGRKASVDMYLRILNNMEPVYVRNTTKRFGIQV